MDMKTKICTKCGENKSLEEYYKEKLCRDGRRPECKSCTIVKVTKYSKTEKGKLAHTRYNKSKKGKLTRAEYQKSDKGKLTYAKYMKTDKGRATAARKDHSRKINISNSINTLTDKEFNYIIFLQNYQCIGLDHEGNKYFDEVEPQRDHINPVSKGGDFTVYTVQALCRSCDSKKGARYIDYRSDYHKEMIKTI